VIDRCPEAKTLLCVGAAGRLAEAARFGDLVVATATIEHDYRLRFVQRPLPRHSPDPGLLHELRAVADRHEFPWGIHFGPVASGDEDVVDPVRAEEIHLETEALCVAWEGSGGARAARFNGLRFVEIRCITDGADRDAAAHFRDTLLRVMPNLADLLARWCAPARSAPSSR